MNIQTKKFGIDFQIEASPDPNYQPTNWSIYSQDDRDDLQDGIAGHFDVTIVSEKNGQRFTHYQSGVLLSHTKEEAQDELTEIFEQFFLEKIMRSWRGLERDQPWWKKN